MPDTSCSLICFRYQMVPSSLPLLPLLLILALPPALPLPSIEKVTFHNFTQIDCRDCIAGGGRRVAGCFKALSTAHLGKTTSQVLLESSVSL